MYDIFFELNDMHQTVDGVDDISFNDLDCGFLDLPEMDAPPNKSNGCVCLKCGEIYPYAESNQLDGTFKCYSCKKWG